jgi:hypothetical protein
MITTRQQNTEVSQVTFVVFFIPYFTHSAGMWGGVSEIIHVDTGQSFGQFLSSSLLFIYTDMAIVLEICTE